MPSDEDEDIPSDRSEHEGDERDKHLRMLAGITGMPSEAFNGEICLSIIGKKNSLICSYIYLN